MGLFRKGKPNVRTLARGVDAAGLAEAAHFRDLTPGADGGTVDLGVPVREEAVLALGALGPEVGQQVVEGALGDPADRVRVAAVRVLHARRDAGTLAAGLSRLPAGRGHSRRLAVRALADLAEPGCAAALAAALLHGPGDGEVASDEGELLDALLSADGGGSGAADGVIDELMPALADERDRVSERAEDLLVLIAPRSLRRLVVELRAGPGAYRAAAALGRIRDTEALGPLMDALLHHDPRVRAESATALGELRDPAAVEALIHATRDSEHRVRAQAGWALDRLGTVAVVVGVSTLVRPMIHEALSAPEGRPALAEGDGGGPPLAESLRSRNGATPAEPPSMPLVLEPSLAGWEDGDDADPGPA